MEIHDLKMGSYFFEKGGQIMGWIIRVLYRLLLGILRMFWRLVWTLIFLILITFGILWYVTGDLPATLNQVSKVVQVGQAG